LNYREAIDYLGGLLGSNVMVYVGKSEARGNAALVTGVLTRAPELGRSPGLGPEGHPDFVRATSSSWVKGPGFNGFFVSEDDFVDAELDDRDPTGIRIVQKGNIRTLVEPLTDDQAAALDWGD
jgi:hypothetical protein